MKKTHKYSVLVFLGLYFILSANLHANLPDSLDAKAQISILTSEPSGEAVFTVFGHSAIRVHDEVNSIDLVFNYGIFDFNSPNFIYRFTTGETDYMVIPFPYTYYLADYSRRGVNIIEQVVDLQTSEKQAVWKYLFNNIKPENRVYRYNIFYDNCSTRLLDILEHGVDGKIEYPSIAESDRKTFRELLHEHLIKYPWLRFGINIVIGSDADEKIEKEREMMFLPLYEHSMLNKSKIHRSDSVSSVVKSEHYINTKSLIEEENISNIFSPSLVSILVLAIVLISLYFWCLKSYRLARITPATVYIIAGLAGIIVFFLMFFSVHPCTDNNWNLLWLHPLQLLAGILILAKSDSKYLYYYHFINFALLSLTLIGWAFIPQYMELEFIPYILSLLAVSGMQIWMKYKKDNI